MQGSHDCTTIAVDWGLQLMMAWNAFADVVGDKSEKQML